MFFGVTRVCSLVAMATFIEMCHDLCTMLHDKIKTTFLNSIIATSIEMFTNLSYGINDHI